jgi:hypothetical protein
MMSAHEFHCDLNQNNYAEPRRLSCQDARVIVEIVAKVVGLPDHPSREMVSVFMSTVHKFAFGINRTDAPAGICARLCGVTASYSDEAFVSDLARRPLPEWKNISLIR